MERKEQSLIFYTPKVPKIQGNRRYQQPTLPTNKEQTALMPTERQRQYMDQTHTYIRMFCGSLCGSSFLMMICTSPLNWVQFLVTKNGLELSAGLWTLCNHELCWGHTPKPPYYLQYSRAFFLISVLTILLGLGWLFGSCLSRREQQLESKTINLDLKESMFSFMSAISLLFCLNLFLAQVRWHARDVMQSDFLWTYYLNWCSDILYVCAGVISFLNYVSSRYLPSDQNVTVIPTERTRLGFGPVTTVLPTTDEV